MEKQFDRYQKAFLYIWKKKMNAMFLKREWDENKKEPDEQGLCQGCVIRVTEVCFQTEGLNCNSPAQSIICRLTKKRIYSFS